MKSRSCHAGPVHHGGKMINRDYLEKVYAGFLGKCVGIRLGAPVEPAIWKADRIQDVYGFIDRYVKPYKLFAADDDSNGPAYFIRSLMDYSTQGQLTADMVARSWLDYTREGVGMFWWGGYGISTEHTAYLNLKNGVPAPESGSIRTNGEITAQQIGGQIFIDTFGLVNPGNPEKAATYGETAASVSHDGEALNGARFFCAAISHAFTTNDINEIIERGLSTIPEESDYYRIARFVQSYYNENKDDWRGCLEKVLSEWGSDKYPGNCHIIPNAGVCFIALYYGEGNYEKTIEIAVNCGEDTDCNAGNVATVLAVANGIECIPEKYRKPINDMIVLSGVSGYLNIMDVPSFAKEIAYLGYRLQGEEMPEEIRNLNLGELNFDFRLPGSTHGFRASDECMCQLEHCDKDPVEGRRCLRMIYSQFYRTNNCNIFYKPFYTRDDFSDERYMPVFSPVVVSGQKCHFSLLNDQWTGLDDIGINPYVHTINGHYYIASYNKAGRGEWKDFDFVVPETDGEIIDEIGFQIEGLTKKADRCRGLLYMTDFRVYGKGSYSVDFSRQRKDFGSITPLSHTETSWRKIGNVIESLRYRSSFSYTGNYYAAYQKIELNVRPENGSQHFLALRNKGIFRGYYLGFDGKDNVSIYKNEFGLKRLQSAPFDWEYGKTYRLAAVADKKHLALSVDGVEVISTDDDSFDYGMIGFGSTSAGLTYFDSLYAETDSEGRKNYDNN